MYQDDIAALATPPGEGGIAIVRLSGSCVIEKAARVFIPYRADSKLEERKGYSLTLGWIVDEEGQKVDQVLIGLMRGPRSYTGEDVVEINCHGGTLAARRCLEEIMKQSVRMAEPGEFTRRAFLNGRLDASQAEAVIEIVRAKTDKALKLAVKQLEGRTSREIQGLEDQLVGLNAQLEASMDFPDDVGDPDYVQIGEQITQQMKTMNRILAAGLRGEVYRDGISIAISGKPNVGKSSLLNALLKKDRAIVTNIPGTTRDIIEDYINLRGIPVKLIDTAGIRDTSDEIERLGVERSRQVLVEADLIIMVLDVADGISASDLDIYQRIQDRNHIILVNKEDLHDRKISPFDIKRHFAGRRVIWGSVQEEIGLDTLEDAIEEMALSGSIGSEQWEIMLNLRQKSALLRAHTSLQNSMENLGKVPLDCLAVDIWEALDSLGEISGKNMKDEVIDRIFHDFCIGK
ncbi:MAG TPA: tRNA uridine-5-carboxymethylaminomethyl(34) synthesis GTPase MnmE [Syntrophomonadaceae bacterium]|nr:tRNA uridine-5-carboxymethylaminomethyl(34) synthesis GTPase MnmE [Syntrophomonadaceae bacterium]